MKTIEKIDFEKEYSAKIQPLFELGREPLMNSAKKPNYEKFGFIKEDIPELLKLATDMEYDEFYDDKEYEKKIDRFFYATIYAVEILGKLKAVEAIEPFLEKLYYDEDNDFFSESMPKFFSSIGKEAIEPLKEHIESRDEAQLILFEVFKNIIKGDLEAEELISSFLMDYINTTKSDSTHIAFAVLALVDCSREKYIEFVREVFATKDVDFSIGGDIEDIEIRLGIREKRDTPQPRLWDFIGDNNTHIPEISEPKVGRNDPCPCGSGKKYKKCCLNK